MTASCSKENLNKISGTMEWEINPLSLGARFTVLFDLNQWTDCAFAVGDEVVEVINCHKLVLATSSPVFEALFFGPLAETNKVIEVPDIEPAAFRIMIKYMYGETIKFCSILEAGKVLYCAKKYIQNNLMHVCLKYLRDNLHISTLWEILAVAEALYEEDLQTCCVKLMCQYSSEVWLSTNNSMNQSTLSYLLDESCTNLTEIELWNLVLLWAEEECEINNLAITPENKRCVIIKSGLLKKIRFFTFTQSEIADLIVPSGLLTDEELKVINSWRTQESSEEEVYNVQTLSGLNSNVNCRFPVLNSVYSQCYREFLSKRKLYTYYGGAIKTELLCTSGVLIRGLEVFTRIPSEKDYILGHGRAKEYTENMSISISDEQGNVMNKTIYNRKNCVFNTQQKIMLTKPFWLNANTKYTIEFEFPDGEYPLCDLSTTGYSKCVYFNFKDYVRSPGSVFRNLKLSFVHCLMFNI